MRRRDSLCALACWFFMSKKGGTGGGGWDHPQRAVHMVAARLGFETAMVGTRRATPHPDCFDRLRKHYSHLAEGWFLARKAAWSLSGCMATDSAIICSLMSGCGKVKRRLIKARSGHGCSFGVRAWTEMEIRCVEGMCGIKIV